MKKSLRIGYNKYYSDEIFDKHLLFIKSNSSVIDELTIFAEFSHYGYWDLDASTSNAKLLKKRISQYRDAGIKRVGINLLCTLGHTEEGFDVLPRADLQYQVNQDGLKSRSCLCPSNDAFLRYTAQRYAIYADTGADFIWMDDDIRPNNHGVVRDFCYCTKCIQKFNEENKTNYNREELLIKLDYDSNLKDKWASFKSNVMSKLFSTINIAVKKVNPSIEVGFMSIDTNAKENWILASGATKCRPGGGFYTEERPIDIFEKSFCIQNQIKEFPKKIGDIQYEYEAFNYQTLERSVHISELETSLSLMSGCNGVLYNNDIFYDRPEIIDMIRSSANKWNTLTKVNTGCKNAGVYCRNKSTARLLNEISMPVTPYFENAFASFILGDEWKDLSNEEIKEIFKKGIFTDGKGVEILHSLGHGNDCGGKVAKTYASSMAERFTLHPLNGCYTKYYRDVFMNFYYESDAYEFETAKIAEDISHLETITHKPVGCSMYKYHSPLGLRFIADGYLMPHSMKTAAKREQVGNAIDWLTNKSLPIRIKKSIKIIPTVTVNSNGGMNIMLTNASFDQSGSFECYIRNDSQFYLINQLGELLPVSQRTEGDEAIIMIDNINGWDYILLTNINTQQTLLSK